MERRVLAMVCVYKRKTRAITALFLPKSRMTVPIRNKPKIMAGNVLGNALKKFLMSFKIEITP